MKKEKINKEEEVVTGPARQEPSAGGASLAPANARRLGAPPNRPEPGGPFRIWAVKSISPGGRNRSMETPGRQGGGPVGLSPIHGPW
jgi:hypothetical protein